MKIKISIFLLILKNAVSYTKDGKDFKDCSYKFKNRMASFEYLYYPGSYVYPTGKENVAVKVSDEDSVKSENKWQWHLHETFTTRVNNEKDPALYMESMEYPGHFLSDTGSSVGLMYRTYKPSECSSTNLGDKINIYCPESCEPLRTHKDTEYYESCRIHILARAPHIGPCTHWLKMLYADQKRWTRGSRDFDKSGEGWFDFRIISPKTTSYWMKVDQRENCHSSESMPASTIIKQSIGKTSSNTHTQDLEVKIGGSKALKFLALAPEVRSSFSWQQTSIDDMTKSMEHVIGGAGGQTFKVQPGYKWIVYQWVGEAAYFKLATAKMKTCDVPCAIETDKDIDDYCHSKTCKNLIDGMKNIQSLKDQICE